MFQNHSRGKTVDKVRNVECKKKERLIWIPAPSLDNPCGLNYCRLGMTPIIPKRNGFIVGQLHLMSEMGGSFQNIFSCTFCNFSRRTSSTLESRLSKSASQMTWKMNVASRSASEVAGD